MLNVSLGKIYGWKPKMGIVFHDIREGRLSRSTGPAIVSRLDTPRGGFFIIDGYHRIVEAGLKGKQAVEVVISKDLPRIERTGGAHADMVAEKGRIIDLVRELANQPQAALCASERERAK